MTNKPSSAMNDGTLLVFTNLSTSQIIKDGGSRAWVLNPARAQKAKWLVCAQNRNRIEPGNESERGTEPHGCGFLIGKVSGLRPQVGADKKPDGRWIIEISEYASINLPDVWGQWRNPVRYISLSDIGINVQDLTFTPLEKITSTPMLSDPEVTSASTVPTELLTLHQTTGISNLTIADAKIALAKTFGVSPDAVEITIRG